MCGKFDLSTKIFNFNTVLKYDDEKENLPKLYANCTFPQNVHTMKFGEITVFYAVRNKADVLLLVSCLTKRLHHS